jgi:hypothetical protein
MILLFLFFQLEVMEIGNLRRGLDEARTVTAPPR